MKNAIVNFTTLLILTLGSVDLFAFEASSGKISDKLFSTIGGSLMCNRCSEAVKAAKDDAVMVALGQEPGDVFDAAVLALKDENPEFEKSSNQEMAQIIINF